MVREPELCRPLRRQLSYRERCRRVRRTAQESAARAIRGRRAFSRRLCRVRYRPPSFCARRRSDSFPRGTAWRHRAAFLVLQRIRNPIYLSSIMVGRLRPTHLRPVPMKITDLAISYHYWFRACKRRNGLAQCSDSNLPHPGNSWCRLSASAMMTRMHWRGELLHIHVAQHASAPMQALSEARLAAGIGVEGDRYATRLGTYSKNHHIDRQATLIEVETLEAL